MGFARRPFGVGGPGGSVGTTRKWVFPILRLVVFAVIAVALVRLAFFAGTSDDDGAAVPTGSITDPQVTVQLGSIVNDVTLQGTVVADAPVGVKATGQGTVDEVVPKIRQALGEAAENGTTDVHALSQVVRRTVGRWVNTKHRRRPMIVPIVIES